MEPFFKTKQIEKMPELPRKSSGNGEDPGKQILSFTQIPQSHLQLSLGLTLPAMAFVRELIKICLLLGNMALWVPVPWRPQLLDLTPGRGRGLPLTYGKHGAAVPGGSEHTGDCVAFVLMKFHQGSWTHFSWAPSLFVEGRVLFQSCPGGKGRWPSGHSHTLQSRKQWQSFFQQQAMHHSPGNRNLVAAT